ncbi:MAG: uroporphyrinogen decarboxylase family protein [Spirochaetia bacterium]
MNSRDRTFLALDHQLGDRIPIDFWATTAVVQRLETKRGRSYTDFLDDYDVDLRYIEGPTYIGPRLERGEDIWGVKRTPIASGTGRQSESYSEVTVAPLSGAESPEDVDAYDHWPNPDMFDYGSVEEQCDAILQENRVVVFMGDRLNRVAQLKPAMYVRGTENILVDLAGQHDIAEAVFRKIREFYLAYLERILLAAKGKIDIVLTGDDFGAQDGLLMSANMWRDFIKPGFADYIDLIKRHKTISMHHTCGSVVDIIPDMIECGLEVLQSIQPETKGMSLVDLKRMFGKDLCFQGGISIQETMPYGSREEIRHEVKSIANIAKQDGGYIFCTSHNIQADTTVESIVTLMEAYLEYGRV